MWLMRIGICLSFTSELQKMLPRWGLVPLCISVVTKLSALRALGKYHNIRSMQASIQ